MSEIDRSHPFTARSAARSGPIPEQCAIRWPRIRKIQGFNDLAHPEERHNARANQIRRKGTADRRQWRLAGLFAAQQDQPEPVVHAEVVRQADAEVVPEDQAATRLAAADGFAVPDLRARSAPGDSRRHASARDAAQREGRRDQGHDRRERRQDRDDQGLPDSRPLRGRDGDRHRLLQASRRGVSGPRHSARTTTRSCTTTAAARSSTAAARC